jgi:16S rRNA (guanine527-N7)-methyltransferase
VPDPRSAALLDGGCTALGLALNPGQRDQLLAYLDLLARWNRAFNLTAVRDEAAMVTRHLLDSLSIAPLLRGRRLIDVGAGAGLPGIPLAIVEPSRQFTLLDSNGKKTRFMFQALSELGLANARVEKARVEHYRQTAAYDAVVSRAFASLADMVDTCSHLLNPDGVLLAMKGAVPEAEMDALGDSASVIAVTPLSVPGLDEARCLVTLRPGRIDAATGDKAPWPASSP